MLGDGLENTSAQSVLTAATTGCAQRITLFPPPPDWSPSQMLGGEGVVFFRAFYGSKSPHIYV